MWYFIVLADNLLGNSEGIIYSNFNSMQIKNSNNPNYTKKNLSQHQFIFLEVAATGTPELFLCSVRKRTWKSCLRGRVETSLLHILFLSLPLQVCLWVEFGTKKYTFKAAAADKSHTCQCHHRMSKLEWGKENRGMWRTQQSLKAVFEQVSFKTHTFPTCYSTPTLLILTCLFLNNWISIYHLINVCLKI